MLYYCTMLFDVCFILLHSLASNCVAH